MLFKGVYKYVLDGGMETKHTETMVKDVCFNGTMTNTDKYSSPIPLVGLYIAAASMVCALLILCDLWAGFKRKKWWFPCRFFSINSVTLTLISIAAKIPVDLTTSMPSNQDQLSKLCGTVFICVCMIFMRPSISSNAEFESYANVTALSIFVITVVVNICIQMATGVIFSFMVEHVIILICMLILLLGFWHAVLYINTLKRNRAYKGTELMKNGEENMLARLKLCYIYGYHSCLQLNICMNSLYGDASAVCIMCSVVLVQATVRSVAYNEFKFCEGVSDYGWSMWWVVATQISTVAIVTCAMGRRWVATFIYYFHGKWDDFGYLDIYLQFQYLISLRNLAKFVEKIIKFVFFIPLDFIHFVVVISFLMVEVILLVPVLILVGMAAEYCSWKWNPLEDKPDEKSEVFKKQLKPRQVVVVNWLLKKGVVDMERWMATNEQVSLKHLVCLLSTVLPSRESPSYYVGVNGEEIRLSLLSLVLLAEIAKEVKATHIQEDKASLTSILDEVFDILYFIEGNVNIGSFDGRLQSTLAKAICKFGRTKGLGEFVLQQNWDLENCKVEFNFIQKPLCGIYRVFDSASRCIQKETSVVSDLIKYRSDESREAVYNRIEQLFVDMLHTFLAQFPMAVFAHILESPIEEYEERVRLCLGYMCKLQPIESHVRFSFPPGANITSLFHAQTSISCPQVQGVSTLSPNIAQGVAAVGEIQEEEQATEQQV